MMMTSDPIADMLTRIRNANTAKHDTPPLTPTDKLLRASPIWAVAGRANPVSRSVAIKNGFIFIIFVLFEVKFY